jgi:hypothetical protein
LLNDWVHDASCRIYIYYNYNCIYIYLSILGIFIVKGTSPCTNKAYNTGPHCTVAAENPRPFYEAPGHEIAFFVGAHKSNFTMVFDTQITN